MTFRKAGYEDVDRGWEIILQAKALMKRENRLQWDEAYPTRELLEEDVERGIAYVLCEDPEGERPGKVMAYGAVVFDGEPVYDRIEGKWLSLQPFVVLHRLAVAEESRGRGLSALYLKQVELLALSRGVFSFKVDTREDNVYMMKSFERAGFTVCGIVHYGKGVRLAYEKLLKK